MQNPDGYQLGDKVRLRTAPHAGARGLILAEDKELLLIKLDDGNTVSVHPEELTNYSLAARRAWQAQPKQAGRPRSTSPKKMVSIRIGEDVWKQLGEAAELGLISSREQAVNDWLREHLSALLEKQDPK